MGRFGLISKWILQNDLAPPFLEVALLLLVFIASSRYTLFAPDAVTRYDYLTWDTIYVIIFLVAISVVRSLTTATERGETARQLTSSEHASRVGHILTKFLSLFTLTFLLILAVDLAALVIYMGYFFSPSVYGSLGSAPLFDWGIAVVEQLLLLFFLTSLAMALSLMTRSTAISLLVFLVVTVLGVNLYAAGVPGWASAIQLGYGDWKIVNDLAQYTFIVVYEPGNKAMIAQLAPNLTIWIGILYRLLGGAVLLTASVLRFRRMDLD